MNQAPSATRSQPSGSVGSAAEFLLPAIVALVCLFLAASGIAADAKRPNIVLIMSDDMGFSDIGCYGGEIDTPVLDGLAANGLRFTQFYNTARCCPTRASLLTGLYPHQAGVGHMMEDRGLEGYRGDLNQRCRTIAEVLGDSGYSTYMSGKWHVTKHAFDVQDPTMKFNWPRQRGFDAFYGTITGAGSFYDPAALVRENQYITPVNDPVYQPETYYYTDAISDNAAVFLDQHATSGAEKPFFLYVAYTAAHWPMHALPEDIAKYSGKYDEGYGPTRRARFDRMKAMGLIGESCQLSPQAEDWDEVEHKEWEARCMEVYAAMVDSMDRGIGRIVAQLEKSGQLDNTLIFFLQDNGGCAEGMGRRPQQDRNWQENVENAGQPMAPDELQDNIWPPMRTRDGHPVRGGPETMPGGADTYVAYGRGWANVSNTPFREYKHWVHEGGIATPLIVHWPEGLAGEVRGRLTHQPGHLVDIMATCVDVSGADYDRSAADPPLHSLQGVSLRPTFTGQALARPTAIFFEHEGNRAIRDGRWKLVAKGADRPWELYDIEADRAEQNDLAQEHPERVAELAARWEEWAREANVLPWPYGK